MTGTGEGAVERLQALVRIPTVSHRDPARVDTAAFDAFLDELERCYPLLHEHLEQAVVSGVTEHGDAFRLAVEQDTPGAGDEVTHERVGS